MFLSKNKIKYIKSLKSKKDRQQNQHFVIEGNSLVKDIYNFYPSLIVEGYATKEWINQNITKNTTNWYESEPKALNQASQFNSASDAICICKFKENKFPKSLPKLSIFLENVQDPGNIGTIIRTADWMGINNIFLTSGCADIYNSKVVRASMGAIFSMNCIIADYTEIKTRFPDHRLLLTKMEGINYENFTLPEQSILAIGNEGSGISEDIQQYVHDSIHIPKSKKAFSESLNAAMACGIIMAQFKSQI